MIRFAPACYLAGTLRLDTWHDMDVCCGCCWSLQGDVMVWGSNVRGQLGDGTGGQKWGRAEFPVVLSKGPELYHTFAAAQAAGPSSMTEIGSKVVQVSTGHSHSLVLLANGSLLSWGANYYGQLGVGDRRMRLVPTVVARFQTRRGILISSGPYHSSATVECGQGLGWRPDSCDCARGFKGYDCSIACAGSPTPCNGKGTFDRTYRLGNAAADAGYDCEADGSCVCLKGYQGPACEIECKPSEAFNYQVLLRNIRNQPRNLCGGSLGPINWICGAGSLAWEVRKVARQFRGEQYLKMPHAPWQQPLGDRFNCDCKEGWSGLLCDKKGKCCRRSSEASAETLHLTHLTGRPGLVSRHGRGRLSLTPFPCVPAPFAAAAGPCATS